MKILVTGGRRGSTPGHPPSGPDWMVFDVREMFHFFQTEGLKASPEAIARQTRLLGHAPRAFEPFVQETAAAWNAAASVTH